MTARDCTDSSFDLVIRNGLVIDGTGSPGFVADLAIAGGHIAAVGHFPGNGRQEIHAPGLAVTPGFIDIHTHYDGQATWDSMLMPSCLHGVTTIVVGNCGVGFAPARPDRHGWLIDLLEGVEDIPGTALAEGLAWDWETFPDYLDALARRELTVDIAAYVPHAPLRTFVMGNRGGDPAAIASPAEMAEMARLVVEGIAAGAIGFATSRTMVHRSRSGEVVGTYRAPEEELLTIAAAMGRHGKGVLQLISDAYLVAEEDFFDDEFGLIEALCRESGRPLSMTVQQVAALPNRWRQMFARIEALRAKGYDVRAQVAARAIGGIVGLRTSSNPFAFTPSWPKLAGLPFTEKLAAFRNPHVRAVLLREIAEPIDHPFAAAIVGSFDRMFRMFDPVDYEPDPSQSIAAEARAIGVAPAQHLYDVLLEEEGERLLYMPSLNYVGGNLDEVHEMMSADYALFGLSDGGAHCGAICDASFPTTVMSLWVRGNKAGLALPLEFAVHGYTQRNARHVGWHDRGVIKVGAVADINVLELAMLELAVPRPTYDLPAGGMRLLQEARGYRYTIKSGVITFVDGQPTGALPGRLVRGSAELVVA